MDQSEQVFVLQQEVAMPGDELCALGSGVLGCSVEGIPVLAEEGLVEGSVVGVRGDCLDG